MLYAADKVSGDLFRVNLLNTKDHQQLDLRDSRGRVRNSLGYPSALALDSAGGTLYVADGKRLWVVRLNSNPVKIEGPWQPHQFRQLSAVAVDNDNNVWVGDQLDRAIHILSPDGVLIKTFRY
jgi:sugar lactone lactonase YvrE